MAHCVSCFLKRAVACCAIFFTRAVSAGYSTCWIISFTSEQVLRECARSELSAQQPIPKRRPFSHTNQDGEYSRAAMKRFNRQFFLLERI